MRSPPTVLTFGEALVGYGSVEDTLRTFRRLKELKPARWFLKPFPLAALMRALEDFPAEEMLEL